MSDPQSLDLVERLFGLSREGFLEEFFGREPLLSRNPIDSAILSSLPTPASFASMLALLGDQTGSIKIARDSRAVAPPLLADGRLDLQATWSSFYEGCSIILNNLYKIDAGTKELTEKLSLAFGHNVQANAYLTPPDATAFQTHYDTHDVIVVQVAGSKNWRIHNSSPAVPHLPSEHAAPHVDPAILEIGPYTDIRLDPGHALYVPRGRPHKVYSGDDASLHITFGMKPISLADLLRLAIDLAEKNSSSLRRHIGADLLTHPEFRADVASAIALFADVASAAGFPERATQTVRKQLLKQVNPAPTLWFREATAPIEMRWREDSYSEWQQAADGSATITNGVKATRLDPSEAVVVARLRSGVPLRLLNDNQSAKAILDLLALGLVSPTSDCSDG